MKVVLALAPVWQSSTPPLALAFLKSSLLHAGIDTYCIDFSVQFRPIMVSVMGDEVAEEYIATHPEIYKGWAKQIADQKPDVVGFSILMSNIKNTALVAQELRNLLPEVVIISGGPSLTRENMRYIKYTFRFSDFIVEGEGEVPIVELVKCIEDKGDVAKIKQLWLKDDFGHITYTGVAPLHPIDQFHFPDFKDFDTNAYPVKNKLPLLFSRGCILNCNYCENKWNHLTQRSRSAANVFQELKRNVKEYGMQQYIFNDDSLISSKTIRQLEEYSDMVIAEGLQMPWHVYGTRVERLLTEPFVAKLRKSGMYGVSLGIESFSSRVQKEMGKSSRYNDADNCARLFAGQGIKTETWIIYGYPTESDEDFEETLNWFVKNPNIICHATANTFGPNAKYLHDKPGVISFNSESSWDWQGSESTLEKRKQRFLQLASVFEQIRVESKGKFSFHIGDPFYVKYFNEFKKSDKDFITDAWDKLEGTYFEKNRLRRWFYQIGILKEKPLTTITKSQNVEDDGSLHFGNEVATYSINFDTIRDVLIDEADLQTIKNSLYRNIERHLYEIMNLDDDSVKNRIKKYEEKIQRVFELLNGEVDKKILYGITYREKVDTIVKSLDEQDETEIVKGFRTGILPKLRKIKESLTPKKT